MQKSKQTHLPRARIRQVRLVVEPVEIIADRTVAFAFQFLLLIKGLKVATKAIREGLGRVNTFRLIQVRGNPM